MPRAKRYSQLKPTWAKFQNQNLHRRVSKRYRQVKPQGAHTTIVDRFFRIKLVQT